MNNGYENRWKKLADFFSSEENAEFIHDDCIISEEDKDVFDIIKGIKLKCDQEQCNNIKNDIQSKMYDKMFSLPEECLRTSKKFPRLNSIISIVASLLLIITVASVIYFAGNRQSIETISPVTFTSINSPSKVILPDSSSVILNAGSSVTYYPGDFNKTDRKISLIGEALFDIHRDEKKAFIVSSGNIKIKVLGTKFNVRDYSDEKNLIVSLISGSVKIDTDEDKTICRLEPLSEAVLNKKDNSMEIIPFDPVNVAGWSNGELRFRQSTVYDLCKALERRFRCSVIIKNKKINNRIVTGRFTDNESLTDILDILKISFDINYKIEENIITIY